MGDDERRRHRRLIALLDEQGARLDAGLVRLTLDPDAASELFQELFVRLGQSDAFATCADPAGYAWRTAINLAVEWRRRRARESARPSLPIDSRSTPSPLEKVLHDEQVARVLDGLAELSEMSRTGFVLRFIEQQSYEEIGIKLGKTPHQARGLCHAAIKQLRAQFARHDDREAIRHV